MDDAAHALDAGTLAQRFAAGTLSPVAHVQAVLAQAARWEPQIAALWAADADAALDAARASE